MVLRERGVRCTGTIRKDRCGPKEHKAPLKTKEELQNRGDMDSTCDGGVTLIRLHDSVVVTIATNFDTVEPIAMKVRRNKRAPTEVPIPNAFGRYNHGMGGVDSTNRHISTYKCAIQGKKWYWPFVTNCLGILRVAAWRLTVSVTNGRATLDQLTFLRQVHHSPM